MTFEPAAVEPSSIDVDGIRVAYRREGEGHPLLFLHGVHLTRAWLPFHAALATGADVVAPDQPGFGDTPRPDHVRSFDDLVLHYDAVIRTLGLEGADLVGQGHGAWLAARLAITYPERFRSLTLVTPFGLRLPDGANVDIFRLTEEEELEAVLGARAGEFPAVFANEDAAEGAVRTFEERTSLAYLAWNPRYDWRLDAWLARVRIPTLVVGVEDDRYAAAAIADRYAALIPSARFERVTGDRASTPHLVHLTDPERLAGLVLDHIRRA